jgi:hypothetical protein
LFLEKNWKNSKFVLRLLDPPLPTWSHEVAKNWTRYSKYGTFASFWYPIDRDESFNAILLSNLGLCLVLTNSLIPLRKISLMTYKNIANWLIGPWRRNMVFHYHRAIHDTRWLTWGNLEFMKNTVDSLVATLIDLGEGKCWLKTH